MTLSVSLLLSYPFLLLYLPNCFESDPHFSYCSFRSLLSCYFVLIFCPCPTHHNDPFWYSWRLSLFQVMWSQRFRVRDDKWTQACNVCTFETGLSNSIWYFLLSSFCLKNVMILLFITSVYYSIIYTDNFYYPFFLVWHLFCFHFLLTVNRA